MSFMKTVLPTRSKTPSLLVNASPRSDAKRAAQSTSALDEQQKHSTTAAHEVGSLSPWVTHPITAFAGSFLGLGGLFVMESVLRDWKLFPDPMVAVGSFAAVATLLYAAPTAPLGKLYNMLYGHLLSILVALGVHFAGELAGWTMGLSVTLAVSLSIGVMVQQNVPHPPAAACAFIFIEAARAHAQPFGGVMYLIAPGLIGCLYMHIVKLLVQAVANELYDWDQDRRARKAADGPQPDDNQDNV
mmetsp:Transcript_23439/g.69034  ORF Transcript_23439/g.69034 Transcript_23439/m.69034 type:complete len:244 (-) Transcript_23439:267-998(-)